MGAIVRNYENAIELWAAKRLKSPGMIVTQPYPRVSHRLPASAHDLCAAAKVLTTVREEIFESRFTHKNDLVKMGADIETCGKNAIIKGVKTLKGAGEVGAGPQRGRRSRDRRPHG